jgi:hypothetical protein
MLRLVLSPKGRYFFGEMSSAPVFTEGLDLIDPHRIAHSKRQQVNKISGRLRKNRGLPP